MCYNTTCTLNQNPNPFANSTNTPDHRIPLPTALHAQSKSYLFAYGTTCLIKIFAYSTTYLIKILIPLPTELHTQSKSQSLCVQYNIHIFLIKIPISLPTKLLAQSKSQSFFFQRNINVLSIKIPILLPTALGTCHAIPIPFPAA